MAKQVYRIAVGELAANCYFLVEEDNQKAIVIDPGAEAEKIISFINDHQLQVELIEKQEIEKSLRNLDTQLEERIKKYGNKLTFDFNLFKKSKEKRSIEITHTGTILHLDGDTHLSNLKKCSNINTYKQVIFNHN